MPTDDPAATLRDLGVTFDAGWASDDPQETIRPAAPVQSGTLASALRGLLAASDAGRIELGDTFGGGGMGVLRHATQVPLRRHIAVKSLREGLGSEPARLALLREAWITARLEHPNVVPIYDLAVDPEGRPLLALRHIEGTPWSELLDDDAKVRDRFTTADPLTWHLRVLMQVCSTVSFAHSRGILHRDLKPANVIIGGFDEVYVLDWGIAVPLPERVPDLADLQSPDPKQLAGTPCYMAPEMLRHPERVSDRTDVYLLGGILYELLEGRPPHAATTPMESLVRATIGDVPPFSDRSAAELVVICRRALDPDPERRFASSEELRLALASFLEHRGSASLATQAEARLARLEHLAGESGTADASEIDRLFGECRFGFEQALSIWPENPSAAQGLRRVTVAMVEHELGKNDVRAASLLLRALAPFADDALRERVRAELERSSAEEQRLRALAVEGDPLIGRPARMVFAALMGLVWTAVPLTLELLPEWPGRCRC